VKPEDAGVRSTRPAAADGKAAILLYHRIDRSARDRWRLCVSPENFAAQLDRLVQRFQPVPLRELSESVRDGRIRHGSIALTFDDGYRDNLTIALGLMKDRGAPATFFLSGDGAADGDSFWWERLDASLEKMGLDGDAAGKFHWRLARISEEDRRRLLDDLPRGDGPFPPRMTEAEMARLAVEPLAEIGAHGWSHRALDPLAPEEQRREIGENMRTLSDKFGVEIVSFAYPFGGPVTVETREVLLELGVELACAIGTEPVTARTDPLALPRLEVGDWSGEEFEMRLNALLES